MDNQFKNSHGRFQSMITAARLLQAQRWKDPTLRTGLGYCGGNFPADGHEVLPLAIYCTYLLDGKILAAVLIGDLTIHRIACEASGIGSPRLELPPLLDDDELFLSQNGYYNSPTRMDTDVGFAAAVALCLLSSIMSSARLPAGSGSLGKYTSSYENTMAQSSSIRGYANMILPLG